METVAGRVIRAPSLKRGKGDETHISQRVKLERVLGLTVSSNAALDCDPNSELVAYPAGCTVVLFNPRKNRQAHVLNAPRKTITCVAFSADGRYLATGECGHAPSVRVWDLHDLHGQGAQQVAEFPGHKYGINCVAFSPSHKYVVSVGSQHDMIVNVWDWRGNIKVASNKVSSKVKAVSFAENGSYFVTVGNRHVKFWYLEYSRAAKYKEPVPLMGRSAILGEQRNNYFCDVACGRGETGDSTYAITKSGLLCEFNNRRLLDKWVELRTTSANCMSVGEHHIFIGCADGIVRCFSPSTLQFITTLPRTHYLGVDVAQGLNISHMATHPNNAKYPDAIALAYDGQNQKLTCVYNDHSLYVWDVRDIKRVGKSHSFLYHSACIWGVEMYPAVEEAGMPPGSFVTCSSDDTIRIWNLDSNIDTSQDPTYRRNIYSNELLKVHYVDPELTYLKDLDLSTAEKTDSSYDGRNGVRSIRISPDGRHLASGDRAGNIRIHEVRCLQEQCRIEAHDAEVLCLEYTRQDSGHKLLASASRDRLIHVFSVEEDYNFVQTLDDHSSSITAVRFLNSHQQLQMVSCGADKSIIFRQLTGSPGGSALQFSRGHNAAGKTTLYDMEVDCGQKHILTACQDRNIRVYNVTNGKHSKTFKGSVGEDGSLIKVVLDPSGIFVATSCTDKTLCVYDYYSGECMATMLGHSELVTGLRFTNDCRRLVSASGDGCIFVWKVPHDMVVTMHARLAQQAARAGRRTNKVVNGIQLDNDGFGPPPPELLDPNANSVDHADYRFSVGQLPLWAKKQIKDDVGDAHTTNLTNNRPIEPPKGRWAQRLDATGITVKSVYDSDSVIPFPLQQEKRADSDGSKDSSIDSGTEIRHYSDFRRETMLITKQGDEADDFLTCPDSLQELLNGEETKQIGSGKVTLTRGSDMSEIHRNRHHTDDSSIGSYKYEDMESTEHDGDVEDYSEGEGESTEPEHTQRLIYYPAAEEAPSVYTVNAMDVEELRRSQRRLRKNQRPERLTDLPLVSVSGVSGSQDSDDDDEEASTPSADTAERNLMSMLSVSTESLDLMGQREKYLKNTFDSLSGAEQDPSKEPLSGKKSISAQYLGRFGGSPRNTAVINAAWQSRTEPESLRKREELKKRIEETRRKLQSVGYRSNLKSSQSIQDLSRFPEKERRGGAPHRMLRPPGIAVDSDDGGNESGGGIRRACSLSDLANPTPRRTPVQVSGKVTSNKSSSGSRTLPRPGFKPGSIMTRSSSVGVLNQSDSESDLSLTHRPTPAARMNGLMRPTISSQNKMASGVGGKTRVAARRGLSGAFSSMNLSQVGNNEDSSSEEASPVTKPRQRSSSIDRSLGAPVSLPSGGHSTLPHRRSATNPVQSLGRFGNDRELAAPIPPPRPTRLRANNASSHNHQLDPSPQELPVKDTDSGVDLASAPLSRELISSITEQLMRTADTVVQLHKRLAMENSEPSDRDPLLQGLEGAVGEAQRTLRLIAGGQPSSGQPVTTNGVPMTNGSASDPGLTSKLQDLMASGGSGSAVTMMQQYSDLLLSLVQQRVATPVSSSSAQSPTSPTPTDTTPHTTTD